MKSVRLSHYNRRLIANAVAGELTRDLEVQVNAKKAELAAVIIPLAFTNAAENPHYPPTRLVYMTLRRHENEIPAYVCVDVGQRDFPPRVDLVDEHAYQLAREDMERTEALHAARNKIHQELTPLLESCTTTKQLLEAWPDGAKYVAEALSEQLSRTKEVVDRKLHAMRVAALFDEYGIDSITPLPPAEESAPDEVQAQ